MKKSRSWIFLTILYILLCCVDGALTFYHTPDLRLEGNPLVAKLGLGWGALFIANTLGVLFYALTARAWGTYQLPTIQADSILDWDAKLFYGESAKKSWLFYRLPKNWKPFWHLLGFAFMPSLILARIIVVLEWAIHDWSAWYTVLRGALPLHRVDFWAGILTALIFAVIWMLIYYRKNQSQLTQTTEH